MTRLTVVISAFNQEGKVKACLESIQKLADEIIFIDNSSTDKTPQIAKDYTSKIFVKENNPMLNVNKNFGIGKAVEDWVLYLDGDEVVTPELKEEIKMITRPSTSLRAEGFFIPRRNIIFGKWIKHTGWYPDYQLRLFKRGKGKFPAVHVHEMIEVAGNVGHLKNDLEHPNYETISQFLFKMINLYTPNEAQVLLKNGYQFNWLDVLRMPAREFINRFFAQKGYQDGLHGLTLSLLMAFYHLIVVIRVWEVEKFKEVSQKEVLIGLGEESKKIKKELRFWYLTALLSEAGNFLGEFKMRLKRKFR